MTEIEAPDTPMSLSYSPDGSLLACGHYAGEVTIWDVAAGGVVASWVPHDYQHAATARVTFAPCGRQVVSVAQTTVRVHGVGGELVRELHPSGFCYGDVGVGFLADGRLLTSFDGQTRGSFGMKLFHAVDWGSQPFFKIGTEFTSPGHFAVEPGGVCVASQYGDVFDLKTRAAVGTWIGRIGVSGVRGLRWCPGRPAVAFYSQFRPGVGVADPSASRRKWLLRPVKSHGVVKAFAFTPDGASMLTGGEQGRVRVIDTATWAERRSLDLAAGWVHDLRVSPDGLTAAAACGAKWAGGGRVVIWDLQ